MSAGAKSIKVNMTLKMIQEVVSIVYPLVTSMYVIRTLGKQNYGEIQYVRSVISYFSLVASLGIAGYASREGAKIRDDRQRFQQFSNEIFTISSLSTAVALLAMLVFLGLFNKGNAASSPLLYMIGFAPIIFKLIGRDWINTVFEDFLYVTVRYIVTAATLTALIFLLIRKEQDYILYYFLISGISCTLACLNCIRVQRYSNIGFAAAEDFKKHLSPIFLIFFSGIASMIYLNSDVTLLGILVNKEAVAVYSVAATIYSMTKQVSNSIVTVTIPRLSYYTGTGNELQFRALIEKMLDYVLILVIPSTMGLFELRRNAMAFIGGAQYAEGGMTLFVLALALPFAVVANVFAHGVLLPRRKEKVFLYATVTSAALNIGLNFVFLPWISHLGAALTTLMSEIVIFSVLVHEARKHVTVHVKQSTIVTAVIGSLAIVAPCEVAKRIFQNNIVCVLAAILSSVILYFLVLVIRKHAFVNDVKDLLLRFVKRKA